MFLKCFLIFTKFELHVSYINVSYIKKKRVTLKMLKNVMDDLSFISQCNFVVSVIVVGLKS